MEDRTHNELVRLLFVASGTDNAYSRQFEEILKDKFLKALSSNIAANSGNWNYTDLETLANCVTQAINANKRYCKCGNLVLAIIQKQLPPINRLRKCCCTSQTFLQFRGNSFRTKSRFPTFCRTPTHFSPTVFTNIAPFQRHRHGYRAQEFRNYHQYHQPQQRFVSQNY